MELVFDLIVESPDGNITIHFEKPRSIHEIEQFCIKFNRRPDMVMLSKGTARAVYGCEKPVSELLCEGV